MSAGAFRQHLFREGIEETTAGSMVDDQPTVTLEEHVVEVGIPILVHYRRYLCLLLGKGTSADGIRSVQG